MGLCIIPISMKSANTTYILSLLVTGFQSRILERNGMKLLVCIILCCLNVCFMHYYFHQFFIKKHFKHFSTVSFILGFILRPTFINKLFPLPYRICHVFPHKCSTQSTNRAGCSACTSSVSLSLHSDPISSPTFRSSVPLESSSSLQLLWSEAVSSSSKRCSILKQALPLC